MVLCIVVGCSKRSGRDKDVSFSRLPTTAIERWNRRNTKQAHKDDSLQKGTSDSVMAAHSDIPDEEPIQESTTVVHASSQVEFNVVKDAFTQTSDFPEDSASQTCSKMSAYLHSSKTLGYQMNR